MLENLKQSGAYIPRSSNKSSPVKPAWWSQSCEAALKDKASARRQYLINSEETNLELYIQAEEKAERVIRVQKRDSFRAFCGTISSDMAVSRIWSLIRPFQGKSFPSLNSSNDPDSEDFAALQRELIGEGVPVRRRL